MVKYRGAYSAGMAELADAQDLGSCVNSCRFDPCYPHQTKTSPDWGLFWFEVIGREAHDEKTLALVGWAVFEPCC